MKASKTTLTSRLVCFTVLLVLEVGNASATQFRAKLTRTPIKKDVEELQLIINDLRAENADKAARINLLRVQLRESDVMIQRMKSEYNFVSQGGILQSMQKHIELLELSLNDKEKLIQSLAQCLAGFGSAPPQEFEERTAMASALNPLNLVKNFARFGISAEIRSSVELPTNIEKKSSEEIDFIRKALHRNVFLKELDAKQLEKLIDYMTRKSYRKSATVINEGDFGTTLYVLEKGKVEVYNTVNQQKNKITDLERGAVFGELAILYNCKRTASVVTTTDVELWSLDRKYFQVAIKNTGNMKRKEYLRLLKTVEKLKALPENKLLKIADCLEESTFQKEDYIIRQGDAGDTFYIIEEGKVKVTQFEGQHGSTEQLVCYLQNGDYFGEAALLTEDKRTANVIVESDTVKLLMLDRKGFQSFVGSIPELSKVASPSQTEAINDVKQFKVFDDSNKGKGVVSRLTMKEEDVIQNTPLNQLKIVKVLGQGGFGTVKLVLIPGLPKSAFALKSIRKARIIKSGQEQHVLAEKNIMMAMKSPFIGRLYRTYKDELKVYFLLEAYLGGEVYRLLSKGGPLPESSAQFCSACVLEALEYLHLDGIVYRDLKPENLMVDHFGYIKLVDFGFAKRLKPGFKTWTFCGTPEYFPPEIISNKGHDFSADIWSFGILVYELLSKTTPFFANDDVRVYENILEGIEGVKFHKRVPKNAETLVRGLCKLEPRDRLGYQKNGFGDIRKQRWYQGFDWRGLRQHKINSPITVDVKNPTDTRNFENIKEDTINAEEDRKIIARGSPDWDASF